MTVLPTGFGKSLPFGKSTTKKERKKDNCVAKRDLDPKGADNTNNTQDNHQTDIFNTYHIYT